MNNPIETDAVIIGAGPVGLFQVFELGLLEMKAHVLDSLNHPGGQCVELYPDKPIYDIPAVPVCTAKELTENLLKQIEPFKPTFHYGEEAQVLKKLDDGRLYVKTSKGTEFLAKAVFIASSPARSKFRTLNSSKANSSTTASRILRFLKARTSLFAAAETPPLTGASTSSAKPKALFWFTAEKASELLLPL